MTLADIYDLCREALVLVLLLSLPILGVALLTGVFVALLSSYTQLSDPYLGLIARVGAVFLVLLVAMPWLADSVAAFARETWSLIQLLHPGA